MAFKIGSTEVINTSAQIASDRVVTASIADDAITSALIADDAVVTAAIADDAITSALLATNSVGTDAINLATNYLFTGRLAGDTPFGIASHDNSTSFNGTTRVQGLDTALSSSDVTISTANNRLTPTISGAYFCGALHSFNGSGAAGYTPVIYLRRDGSAFQTMSYIESYSSGHTETHFTFGIQDFNGSTHYLNTAHNHNAGTTMTSTGSGVTFMFRIRD